MLVTTHDGEVIESSSTMPSRRGHRDVAPSIRDVAAAAGVSYQTVSRVLNDSPSVSPRTRQSILEVMTRLGYRPNRAARALGLGRAQAVTVVTADTMLYGYACTLQGIEQAARVEGLAVGVRVVESDRAVDVRHTAEYVSDPSAGGIVVIAFDSAGAGVLRALPEDVPAVAAIEPGKLRDSSTNHYLPGRKARHRRCDPISTVPGTYHCSSRRGPVRNRHQRAPGRLARRIGGVGARIPPVLTAGWDARSAFEAGQRLAADPTVTAILCGNDDTALAVRRALYKAGRDVPGDVSIVGFDNVPGSAYWTPALTTVHMDFVGLGHACLAAVVAELARSPQPAVSLAAPCLVVRESTAPPRRR